MKVKQLFVRRAGALIALSLIASAVLGATPVRASISSSGSQTIAAPVGVGDTTLKLGPAGNVPLSGVKDVEVTITWNGTLAAQVEHVSGAACQIDQSIKLQPGGPLTVEIAYSYVEDGPDGTQVPQSASETLVDEDTTLDESWVFGICHDS